MAENSSDLRLLLQKRGGAFRRTGSAATLPARGAFDGHTLKEQGTEAFTNGMTSASKGFGWLSQSFANLAAESMVTAKESLANANEMLNAPVSAEKPGILGQGYAMAMNGDIKAQVSQQLETVTVKLRAATENIDSATVRADMSRHLETVGSQIKAVGIAAKEALPVREAPEEPQECPFKRESEDALRARFQARGGVVHIPKTEVPEVTDVEPFEESMEMEAQRKLESVTEAPEKCAEAGASLEEPTTPGAVAEPAAEETPQLAKGTPPGSPRESAAGRTASKNRRSSWAPGTALPPATLVDSGAQRRPCRNSWAPGIVNDGVAAGGAADEGSQSFKAHREFWGKKAVGFTKTASLGSEKHMTLNEAQAKLQRLTSTRGDLDEVRRIRKLVEELDLATGQCTVAS